MSDARAVGVHDELRARGAEAAALSDGLIGAALSSDLNVSIAGELVEGTQG